MNTRLTSKAVLLDENVLEQAPKPAQKVVRFADTPVDFAARLGAFEIASLSEPQPKRPEPGRRYH